VDTAQKWKVYTVEDIYALPDGQRAELIDGKLYGMAPPGRKHQKLVSELHYRIRRYIDGQKGACEVYVAPFAVFLTADDTNYVEPDISVICDKIKLNDQGCMGAPDWVIEVASPGSKYMDYSTKLFKYRSAGVREYWIVDEGKNRITVYDFRHDKMEEYAFTDTVKAGIFDHLEIHFAEIDLG